MLIPTAWTYLSAFDEFDNAKSFDYTRQMYALSPPEHAMVKRAYYAAISFVDSLIGEVLRELE